MGKSLRRVLACVLMLAVPLQGFAAVAMLNCAPDHHNAAGPASHASHDHAAHGPSPAADPQHDHAMHAHAGQGGHADVSAVAAEMDDAAPVFSALQSLDTMEQLAKTTCSACASCCSGAAIVSSMVIPAVFTAGSVPFRAATDSPVSFITDGPSRPPRPLLA